MSTTTVPPITIEPRFYTPKEVAELLSVSVDSVRQWEKNGLYKATRVGRSVRIHAQGRR